MFWVLQHFAVIHDVNTATYLYDFLSRSTSSSSELLKSINISQDNCTGGYHDEWQLQLSVQTNSKARLQVTTETWVPLRTILHSTGENVRGLTIKGGGCFRKRAEM